MTEFTLKYRPKKLSSVVGQPTAIKQIQGMINRDKIPNAIIIEGPSGVGKTTLANIIAYAATGEKYGAENRDIHSFNIGDQRGIDFIRELNKIANYMPKSKRLVFILDEAQQLTSQAANAILTPLEKVNSKTLWIFCTSDIRAILFPIKRRCQIISLSHPKPDDLLPLLKAVSSREKCMFENTLQVVKYIAAKAYGNPSIALNLLETATNLVTIGAKDKEILKSINDNIENIVSDELAVSMLAAIYKKDIKQTLMLLSSWKGDDIQLLIMLLNYNSWMINIHLNVKGFWTPHTESLKKKIGSSEAPKLDACINIHVKLVQTRQELLTPGNIPDKHLLTASLVSIAKV